MMRLTSNLLLQLLRRIEPILQHTMNAAINHKLEKTKTESQSFSLWLLPLQMTRTHRKVTWMTTKLDVYLLVLYISVCDAKVVLLQQIEMVAHFVKHKLALGSFLEDNKQLGRQEGRQTNMIIFCIFAS